MISLKPPEVQPRGFKGPRKRNNPPFARILQCRGPYPGELDRLTLESIERSGRKFSAWNKERIRSCIASAHIDGGDLARYVPYRLVRPFFPETNGAKDHLVNGMVAEMCTTHFADRKPLYRFHGADSLEFNANWCTYLRDNLSIVKGWASWNYLQYMQKANPLVPNLSLKLFAPAERESLAWQTKFWNKILDASAVTCIYTGERLTPKAFALDHFLPWSFVVHNEPWNLIPVSPTANAARSDRLPAPRYFEPFVATHHSALRTGKELLKDNWKGIADLYALRLKVLTVDELLNLDLLAPAYERLYQPQLELAKLNGFQPDWSYRD